MLYNLMNHAFTDLIMSTHVPGEVGVVAIRDIPNETDPFVSCNIPKNPEMVNIRESSLHNIPEQVIDHVKKFVTPHVTNDGEKVYPISENDLYCTNNIKFSVKTTSDANQSNCKYMPGPGYMTMKNTRLIKTGDELLLFYELPNYDDKLRDDNDCSDLEKKSSGVKRKLGDELSEDDRRYVFVLDNERREYEVMKSMTERDVEFWEKQIQEINAKENLILGPLGGGDELSEDDGNDIRSLNFERQRYKLKIEMTTSEFEFYKGEIQENTSKINAILEGGSGWGDFVN